MHKPIGNRIILIKKIILYIFMTERVSLQIPSVAN